jgi:hypothetical protein
MLKIRQDKIVKKANDRIRSLFPEKKHTLIMSPRTISMHCCVGYPIRMFTASTRINNETIEKRVC